MDTREELALFLFQTDRSIYPQVHDTFCDLTGEDEAWFLALADGFLASSVVAHIRAEALREWADFQDRVIGELAYVADDVDRAEVARWTASVRAYANKINREENPS